MHTSTTTRLAAASIAFVMTFMMLVSVNSLASHEAQLASMATNAVAAAATHV